MTTSTTEALFSDGTMTVRAAHEFSGIAISMLYVHMANGTLVYSQVGRRRLIPRKGLLALITSNIRVLTPDEIAAATARAAR